MDTIGQQLEFLIQSNYSEISSFYYFCKHDDYPMTFTHTPTPNSSPVHSTTSTTTIAATSKHYMTKLFRHYSYNTPMFGEHDLRTVVRAHHQSQYAPILSPVQK